MKRKLIVISTAALTFAGVSCEKHTWEDQIEVVEEKVFDDKGNVIATNSNKEVSRKGTKRFFIEDHGKKSHKAEKPTEGGE